MIFNSAHGEEELTSSCVVVVVDEKLSVDEVYTRPVIVVCGLCGGSSQEGISNTN